MKRADRVLADDLIRAANIMFSEFGLPNKKVLDAGTNFLSDQFKQFCRQLNIDQAITSSHHYQSNAQCSMYKVCQVYHPKCFDKNNDVNLTLLQKILMPIVKGLPSAATLLSNRPIRSWFPQINKKPINFYADDENYEALRS